MKARSRLKSGVGDSNPQKARVRYSVDLPTRLDAKITALAEEAGEQKSDVIRRAIGYFLKCEELRHSGYTLQLQKEEAGKIKAVEILTI